MLSCHATCQRAPIASSLGLPRTRLCISKACLACAQFFFAAPSLAVPILGIQPAGVEVTVGQSFTVDVTIDAAVDVFAFQFDLGFDPNVLTATGIAEGSFLSSGGATFFIPGDIDNLAGSVSFTANSLLGFDGVDGSGTLARISFTAVGVGSSAVTIFNAVVLDSTLSGVMLATSRGNVSVAQGQTTTVPEPSSLTLACIAALLAIGRSAVNGRQRLLRNAKLA